MRFFLLACGLLSTFFAMSQTIYDIIDKLDKAKLITAYERKEFLKEVKEREERLKKFKDQVDNSSEKKEMREPHYPLVVLLSIKKYSTPGVYSLTFRPATVVIKKGQEQKVADHLRKYGGQLFNAGLISDKTFNEALSQVNSFRLLSEYELVAFAEERTEKEYFLTPKMLGKFVDQLRSKELITVGSYDEIMKKSAAGEFRQYDEILKYVKNLIVIDPEDYPGEPENYIEPIYRKTATVFPGLEFDSLKFTVEQDKKESFKDFVAYDMTVTIKKDRRTYRYKSFFTAEYKNKKEGDISKLPETYYEIFNKILSDQVSAYRIHYVGIDNTSFGIVAMTKNQFENLLWQYDGMRVGGYINLSYENFNNKLTQEKINAAIELYDSIGLFSHLSQAEKDSCITEISGKEINYYSDILSSFKDIVFEIDLEYGVNDNQYREITERIASISKDQFVPIDIIDTYNYEKRKSFEYGFTLGGKKYLANLNQQDDWLDTGFWELIEKAVADQDKTGKFYYLLPADGMRQIYLTSNQFEVLKKNKMIELEEADIKN